MKERQLLAGRVIANPPLNNVAEKWLASIEVPKVVVGGNGNMVAAAGTGRIRRQTWDQYEGCIYRLVEPALGALKINEINTSTCDSFLRSLVVGCPAGQNGAEADHVLRHQARPSGCCKILWSVEAATAQPAGSALLTAG